MTGINSNKQRMAWESFETCIQVSALKFVYMYMTRLIAASEQSNQDKLLIKYTRLIFNGNLCDNTAWYGCT